MADQPQSSGASVAERLTDQLSQFREALAASARSIRVALPATVVSFNVTAQTVVVQPAITELARTAGVIKPVALPQIQDVPISLPRAGGFGLTLPIQPGDECLLVFADTCLDAWWQSGAASGPQNQVANRRHHLSDAVALIGLWSQPNTLSSYSTNSAQLRSDDGSTIVDIKEGQVTVTAATVDVNATTANVAASSTATVSGATVNVSGSSAVHISGNANTTIEGRNFLNHTHSGVSSGSSNSGPVV